MRLRDGRAAAVAIESGQAQHRMTNTRSSWTAGWCSHPAPTDTRTRTHIPPCPPSLPLPSLCRCRSHDALSAVPRVRSHVLALRQRQPVGNFRFADQVWSKQVRAERGTPRSVRDDLRKPGLVPQPRLPNSEALRAIHLCTASGARPIF